ncbi:MAG: 50S ribosomal protein L18 [Myxococcales bacterium FL481]|nr:MAG: 50S ribosomal protein L18 [Myxococcales bacterium FL481]
MAKQDSKLGRDRRRRSIRLRVSGSAERPRMTVFRSNKHIYAQVVNDADGSALVSVSTLSKALAERLANCESKVARAQAVGEAVAKACEEKGIKRVVFDRNGYQYRGAGPEGEGKPTRVAALAEAARAAGLEF